MSDWVALIEAAYCLDGDLSSWLQTLLAAAAPVLDAGEGVEGHVYTSRPSRFEIHAVALRDCAPGIEEFMRATNQTAPEQGLAAVYRNGSIAGSLHEVVLSKIPGLAELFFEQSGRRYRDVYGVVAQTGTGHGVAMNALHRGIAPQGKSDLGRWTRAVAHIGAGLRLRLALGSTDLDDASVEGVLDADAMVHDARGAAKGSRARDALREAVLRRERAREQRSDPDSALPLWEGLVAGRWSLVDHFDADGRRFVVARRNDPNVGDPRGLTLRERQVAEFLGLGRSAKEVAYLLGVSNSAISNAIARVQAKLGLGSRVEVAAFFAPSGLRARLADFDLAGEPLAVASLPLLDAAIVERLTEAERDVALLLLQGATNAAIGAARDTSEHTVAAQLQSIFGKVGVHSRSELATRLGGSS